MDKSVIMCSGQRNTLGIMQNILEVILAKYQHTEDIAELLCDIGMLHMSCKTALDIDDDNRYEIHKIAGQN